MAVAAAMHIVQLLRSAPQPLHCLRVRPTLNMYAAESQRLLQGHDVPGRGS